MTIKWWYAPIAIWAPWCSLICAAAGWVAHRNKGASRADREASAALEQTGAGLPGSDGASIEDYYVLIPC